MALVIGALVIAGARSILGTLADHADRITEAARTQDRIVNGERTLRALVASLDLSALDGTSFSGDERVVAFASWCPTPDGWQERCQVRLAIVQADSLDTAPTVAAILSNGEVLTLITGVRVTRFAYLSDASAGGMWVRMWGGGITAPLALGIMTDRDTLIVRIGERG